jgi:hypothetical protein
LQIEIGDWKTKSQIEVADGPPIVHIPEDRSLLTPYWQWRQYEKVKAYFRLATDARPPWVAQKREPTWRSAGRTAVRSEDSPGQRLSGAGHAERSMSDARGHKHRPANGRRAGAVPHGEAKAWLVRQGRGGRKEANPRTTSVWNPLLLFDLASTTSSTLGKSGPSALSRLRPRRPQGLFFDFGLEGPHAKRDR